MSKNVISKGKLIVIEGIDGSGKTTQNDLLVERLKSINKKVNTIKFPRHNTPFFGTMVDEYLNNKFGPADKLDPRLASLLFACDRWEVKDQLLSWLSVGSWIIPDRYVTSNLGHQLGKLATKEEKDAYIKWEIDLEYKTFHLPQPDLVLYLDVPLRIIKKLLKTRAGKEYIKGELDGHEASEDHLKSAREAYIYCLKKFPNWKRIECMEYDQLLSPKEIHSKIWNKIRESL